MRSSGPHDRRTLERIPLQLPIELFIDDESRPRHKAMSVNLHYRGAEITTDIQIHKGTPVTIQLPPEIAGEQSTATPGEIRWRYKVHDHNNYGIAFNKDFCWRSSLNPAKRLESKESLLAMSVLNALDMAVFSVNKQWQITLFNKAAEKMTGCQRHAAIGKKCRDIFNADHCSECFLTEAVSKGASLVTRSLFFSLPSGQRKLLQITSTPLISSTGNLDGFVQLLAPAHNPEIQKKNRHSVLFSKTKLKPTICIRTLGGFSVNIHGKPFYDRLWKGRRSKELLKAIIALGGTKISIERLANLFWPDSDGDRALNNLKMALSRLRRIGCPEYALPANWLVVKHKRVSLTQDLCKVDALEFSRRLKKCYTIKDHKLLQETLLLYTNDFLPQDEAAWTIPFREHTRSLFIEGVLHLASLKRVNNEILLALLEQACHTAPLHEEVYASLMNHYIQAGYPATALEVFDRAKTILFDTTGILPGIALCTLARQAKALGK